MRLLTVAATVTTAMSGTAVATAGPSYTTLPSSAQGGSNPHGRDHDRTRCARSGHRPSRRQYRQPHKPEHIHMVIPDVTFAIWLRRPVSSSNAADTDNC